MPPHRLAYRPTVMGRRGVVTSAHPLASMAGIEILLAGGNAVDAAVAVASTLNVVEPFMSGAGGIGLMLISRGDERHVLDFIGPAPRAADAARCTDDELAGGPKSCATPGNLGGWLAALERFGTMDRARVLAPAIGHAERGVPLTLKNAEFIDAARATLARSREAERLYLGGTLRAGAVATYTELAATLRQVAEGGAEAFYRGPIATAIARAVREAGGWLDEDDLAAFRPEWRPPVAITYRGQRVYSMPPPFSAFQMLETLNILEGHDLGAWGHNSVESLHHLIEAVKLASADRLAYAYSDDVPITGLLSKAYADSQRARIDPTRAGVSEGERHSRERLPQQITEGHPAKFADEQTTHFACADAAGTVVSVTQTLGVPFGSGFAIPGTGLVLNNILKWMDRDPASPNVVRPRPQGGHDDVADAGVPRRNIRPLDRHARVVRHSADDRADAAQRARVRDEHPGGDRGPARARLSRSPRRRRGAYRAGRARGARRAGAPDQHDRGVVLDRRGRPGHHARRRVGRAHDGCRPAPRRLRARGVTTWPPSGAATAPKRRRVSDS